MRGARGAPPMRGGRGRGMAPPDVKPTRFGGASYDDDYYRSDSAYETPTRAPAPAYDEYADV